MLVRTECVECQHVVVDLQAGAFNQRALRPTAIVD